MAWQFDRSDLGEGMVQAFRREGSPYYTAQFKLSDLDPEALYTLTDLELKRSRKVSGYELMEQGLLVTIADQPGAVAFTYKKVKQDTG